MSKKQKTYTAEFKVEAIKLIYNQRRIQKSLDFKTPNQIAENFYRLAA
ncbi:hypothetical protein ACI8B_100065 [Acinetobacter proteolyticus]|uniref:Uncharacterized protein n=1 Tax=Acinetobacter proteolyticus TaxID=1776741 RepID=A0A653JZP7_9GAMM|nr:hypothetical protein ACI8B_100065 [Acinetobacter proteolyticus]